MLDEYTSLCFFPFFSFFYRIDESAKVTIFLSQEEGNFDMSFWGFKYKKKKKI
jgi:hypothetical protein